MKSFKNSFLMLFVLTAGLLDVKITKTVDAEETTLPENSDSGPSKSFLDRMRESEFNRKLNERFDKLTNRFKKSTTESVQEEPSKPLLKVPELNLAQDPANEVAYGVPDTLPDEEEFPKTVDNLHDWDITTDEEKNLEALQSKALLDAENKRIVALKDKVAAMTTPEEIKTLTPQDIQDLSTEINTLPAKLIHALTPEQIQNMTVDQIVVLNKEQIQNFNFKDLTVQQIKRLVQKRSAELLQNLTDAQLSSLSSEQMEACLEAIPETFTEEQLDSLRQLLRLRGGSAAKIWLKDLTMKNFKNIFKSDSELLEEYLTDPSLRKQRLEEFAVRKTLAKLSRTQTAELFTKITHNEIAEIRKKNPTLSKDEVEKLYIETFNKNEPLFKQLLKEADPAGKKQYILIPSRPSEIKANSLVNFKFEILDMSSYNSNLTIAENAERMKKSQDLSTQAEDVYARAQGKPSTTDLTSYIRNYLQDNPNEKNLKALLVNDFTALNRTTNLADAQAKLAKILNTSPKMESLFRNLTADQLTDITKAQIRAQEQNMNLAGRGAKVSYAEAARIFKQNAEVYQRFTKKDNLIVPTKSNASENNQNSFKFEIINLDSIRNDLATLDYKNVDLEILDPSKSRQFRSQKNIKATDAMNEIIQKIRTQQPEIELSDIELAKELINSLRKNKIELPKQKPSPTEALTKLAEEKYSPEEVNKIIMDIRKTSKYEYDNQTTEKVNQALQKLIYSPRQ